MWKRKEIRIENRKRHEISAEKLTKRKACMLFKICFLHLSSLSAKLPACIIDMPVAPGKPDWWHQQSIWFTFHDRWDDRELMARKSTEGYSLWLVKESEQQASKISPISFLSLPMIWGGRILVTTVQKSKLLIWIAWQKMDGYLIIIMSCQLVLQPASAY